MLTSSTQMTGFQVRYRNSLEVAKGVSQYLITLIDQDELCNLTNCSEKNQPIRLGRYSQIGDYKIDAKLLSVVNSGGASIYAIKVSVINKKIPSQRSTVEFVYKVE